VDKIASELLVERLADWGVDTVFGLPGDGINGIMEGLRRHQDDRQLHLSGNLAIMACALPYAIAAQWAYPGRQCVALSATAGWPWPRPSSRTRSTRSAPEGGASWPSPSPTAWRTSPRAQAA
jgi:thiamine pyrophosphate-dependent acetolactate synthase large subunit-like protein